MKQLLFTGLFLLGLILNGVEYIPFKEQTTGNCLIVRLKLGKDAPQPQSLPEYEAEFTDGDFILKQKLSPLNPVASGGEIDYELPLGAIKNLSASSKLKVDGPSPFTVYEVIAVTFRSNDLSEGFDFETPERCGTWLGNLGGTALWSQEHAFRGTGCLKASWKGHQMVSLIPGERDWTPYAELRFTVTNPLTGQDGRRNRNFFLFDGKNIYRPSGHDTIPSGNLDVMRESTREYRLDLVKLRKNHPKLDLKNIKAFQIFWSSTRSGPTTFHIDEMRLLTKAQLEAEKTTVYRDEFKVLKKLSAQIPGNRWQGGIDALRKRYEAGERESLDHEFVRLREAMLNAALCKDSQLKIVATSSSEKIMRDTMFKYNGFPHEISAAGNERESFQLVLAPGKPLKNVTITSSVLKNDAGNTIPAGNVQINPIGYVEVAEAFYYPGSRKGFWPDILHENRPFDLEERVQPYMVTVAVPAKQPAGFYRGTLTINAEGIESQIVEYRLKVYGFSLPQRGQLKTCLSINYMPNDPKLRRKVLDLIFEYRQNPVYMYQRINKDSFASTHLMITEDDLPYCLEKGMNVFSLGYILDKSVENPNIFDQAYIDTVLNWIGKHKPMLEKYNAWDIACLMGFDEIMHQADPKKARHLKEAEKICRAIKNAFPDCKIANIGYLMKISPDLMDYWYTKPMRHSQFSELQRTGRGVGFYWAYENPSFMLDLPGIASRMCSWMAYRENANGIGYYSTWRPHTTATSHNRPKPSQVHADGGLICSEACNPDPMPMSLDWNQTQYNVRATNQYARNGDGVLYYPAPDHSLLASFRLTSIRDGIEDFEYFKLLEALSGGKHPLLEIPENLVSLQGYSCDYDQVQAYRNKVAEAIEELQK